MLRLLIKDNPDYSKILSILFIVSGNWDEAELIEPILKSWFPNVEITYVLRDSYPESFDNKKKIITTYATKFKAKYEIINHLRKQNFDVTVCCWSNKQGFLALKSLGFVVKPKSMLIFNENLDCFWLTRSNLKIVIKHYIWRLSQKSKFNNSKFILTILTTIFLLPLGLLYVTIRSLYFINKKYLIKLSDKT